VESLSEAALSASDDRLVSEPVCGFLCCFWRQADIDIVGAFGVDAAIASFDGAGLIVSDIGRHGGRITIGPMGSSAPFQER
jgi:hypothetical protein